VHGIVENGNPFLRFVSKSGKRELRQGADELGKLLQRNQIDVVVINSCESAKVTALAGRVPTRSGHTLVMMTERLAVAVA
jgi:aspartate-semialdehyde dehydrogenase